MKKQQETDSNRYDEIVQGRKLEEFLHDTWNNRWLETEKGQWTHEIYPDIRSRKEMDHDQTPEMLVEIQHFLTGHGPFAEKLAQMNLKENDKCICGSAQTKHLWESCTKSELKHLYDTEPNLTRILQDKDKRKEFQLLVKEMKKKLKDEEYQSKCRNAGNRSARWKAGF
jgi:hypothetical protein